MADICRSKCRCSAVFDVNLAAIVAVDALLDTALPKPRRTGGPDAAGRPLPNLKDAVPLTASPTLAPSIAATAFVTFGTFQTYP